MVSLSLRSLLPYATALSAIWFARSASAVQVSYRAPWLRNVTETLRVRQEVTYTNPIIDGNYADPWVFEYGGAYYLLPTMPDGSVSIFKSDNLDDFHTAEPTLLWMPPNPPVWAPELHIIDGNFYIYCALQDGEGDAAHRMHALLGSNSSDPTAPFTDQGQIGTPDQNYAIDGTVLHNYNGANYFIWSGKDSPATEPIQYLYIAKMDTPTSVVGNRTVLHSPYYPDGSKKEWQWAPNGYAVNEGPEVLVNGDQTFLIYSACGSWDPCYGLAIMGLNSTELDPLDPAAWWVNDDGPIFNASNTTVGVGHASFTSDTNGVPYIVYHGWDANDSAGWGSRKVFTQNFTYNADGTPKLPSPAAIGAELPVAAGF